MSILHASNRLENDSWWVVFKQALKHFIGYWKLKVIMLDQMTQKIKLILLIILTAVFSLTVGFLVSQFSTLSFALIPVIIVGFLLLVYFTRNPFIGLLFIIFFLPFERIPSFDIGMVTLKINQFLGGLTLVAWILSLLFQRVKISANALTIPLVLFLTTAFLSIFGAEFESRALQVFIFTLFTVSLFILTVNLVDSEERLKLVIKVLFCSAFLTCLFGFYQFFGDIIGLPQSITGLKQGYEKEVLGFPRVQAFSQEPLYLGNYLLIPLGIALALFTQKIKFVKKQHLFWLLTMMLVIVILTVSRGAYLGLATLILVLVLFMARYVLSWKNIIIGLVIILLVFGGSIWGVQKASPDAYDKFIEHVKVDDLTEGESTQGRLKAWYDAYEAFTEKPLLGIGLGNFGPWVKGYPDPETVLGWDIVNNEYFEVLAETGILGLVTFMILILTIIIRSLIAYKHCRDDFLCAVLVGLFAAFIATLVQYNFFSTLYIIHIWVLIGLLVGTQNLILSKRYN